MKQTFEAWETYKGEIKLYVIDNCKYAKCSKEYADYLGTVELDIQQPKKKVKKEVVRWMAQSVRTGNLYYTNEEDAIRVKEQYNGTVVKLVGEIECEE
jgi:hypothetical protein